MLGGGGKKLLLQAFPHFSALLYIKTPQMACLYSDFTPFSLKLRCGFCPMLYRNGCCQGLRLAKPSGQSSIAFSLPSSSI